jgi:hypothetical protein
MLIFCLSAGFLPRPKQLGRGMAVIDRGPQTPRLVPEYRVKWIMMASSLKTMGLKTDGLCAARTTRARFKIMEMIETSDHGWIWLKNCQIRR